jgi:UDP-N-acetylglucosamine transferase subunit ALG13
VTVGTDATYRFDRLIHWIDDWLGSLDDARPAALVQHGISRPARFAECRRFLAHEEMMASIEKASIVVTHAGPGTLFTCWRYRRRPIVVPRMKALHEAVDNHQASFANMETIRSRIWSASTKHEFLNLISWVTRCPKRASLDEQYERNVEQTVSRFEAVVNDFFSRAEARSHDRGARTS